LIFTLGKQIDTVAFAIENQKPEYVGFVCTEVSEPFAHELIKSFGFGPDKVRKRIVDPFDIRETYQVANLLIQWLLDQKVNAREIAVDITGGLTTLSVGVFSAADDHRTDSQYIRSRYDENNHVVPNTMEGVFVTRFIDS
jgi:hypothetical protein